MNRWRLHRAHHRYHTTITGVTAQVGLLAEVKGTQVGSRTVRATEIEVKDPGGSLG